MYFNLEKNIQNCPEPVNPNGRQKLKKMIGCSRADSLSPPSILGRISASIFGRSCSLSVLEPQMNTRKMRGELAPAACKALEHAWIEAARLSRPLNRFVTVRAASDRSPLEQAELIDRTWNKLGGWSRYHVGGFWCLLVREKEPGGSEHFHVLIHVPALKAGLFNRAVSSWFDGDADVDIRSAHQGVWRTRAGKIRSIIGYLTKQRSPQATYKTAYSRQRGDRILGKRARISWSLLLRPGAPTLVSGEVGP
jgi:hypothetical protein